MANTPLSLLATQTITADKYSAAIDVSTYACLVILWAVTNGPAGSETIDLLIQTFDEDSDDNTDWVNLTPDDASQWTQITGTSGGNPWKKIYVEKFSTFMRWIRGYVNISTGTWTTKVQIHARN